MIPQYISIIDLGILDQGSVASTEEFLTHYLPLDTSWMDWNRSNSRVTDLIFMSPQQYQDELLWLLIMEHCPLVTFDDWQSRALMWKNGINMTVWLDMNGISLYNCIGLDARNWCAVEGFWWYEWIRLREWSLELFEITTINEYNGYNSTGQLLGHSLAVTADLSNASQLILKTADLASESSSVLSIGEEISQWLGLNNLGGENPHWPTLQDSSEEISRLLALRE